MRNVGVLFGVLAVFAAGPVFAQTYYYSSPSYSFYEQTAYAGSCVNIARDLSIGSRGSDVTSLQQFLVSRNYPGGGDWMITGYYGNATAAAVRNFQSAQGLAVTGSVDSQTRLTLDRVSCGEGYTSAYSAQSSYVQSPVTVPTLPYTYSYTQPTYVQPSYPQQSFVPSYGCNDYSGYGGYYYFGVGTYYGNCGQQYDPNLAQLGTPSISYLNPASGEVGKSVTVLGSGFSTTGNTVHFGNGVITNLGSPDGRSISFTVPTKLTGYGSQTVGIGTYYVSVTNAAGYTSNTAQFTVNSLGAAGTPTISNVIGPDTLGAGTSGTWNVTVNNPTNTYLTLAVKWGDTVYQYPQASQIFGNGTQTVSLMHAYAAGGTYTIEFVATNGIGQAATTTRTITVTGSGSSGALSISSVTPVSGPVGTQIAIQGSGFSQYDNTVRFGSGGTMHLPSYNGTTIYYTVPQYLSPCDIITSGSCALYLQVVTPGTTYPLSVTNTNGTSNAINFLVTQ